MRSFSLWMVMALAGSGGLPGRAQAEPQPKQWASNLTCESKLAGTYPLPATLPADTLIRDVPLQPLLRSGAEVEIVCGVFGRPWRSQRTPSYLVFLETETYRSSAGQAEPLRRQLHMALYRQGTDGQYRPVARGSEPFQLRKRQLVDLDLAPYKLTAGEYAFGVRTTIEFDDCEGSYCSGSSGLLDVFRIDRQAIRPILSTLLWSESHVIGPAKEDFSRDHETLGDTTPARISVARTVTDGILDWRKSKGKKTALLKWRGDRYELDDEDPVIDRSH